MGHRLGVYYTMGLSQWSSSPPSSSFFMHAFILLWWCGLLVTSVVGGNNETDRLALLEFKAKITGDPLQVMSSWNDSNHFCLWRGVTCGRRHQRVIVLDLRFSKLPSNVLLDDEMIGHVGDFGLARFLREATQECFANQSSSIGLKGTVGYAPPEYGMGNEVSTFGDIYSYGILLLEMFTGKRPTDNIFKDDLSLHDFVRGALPEQVINIVDPIILLEREDMETRTNDTHIQNRIGCPKILECLILIFGIGVSCSIESPRERMNISDVVAQLHLIRDKLLITRIRRERLQLTGT
ncbi:hypothetical protein SO802_008663 [Lithocarpus litseifolius]|uniref:Protein kinase domain-containing protein n=1 Tax=Lithocarpus litseifolius TaxID=425828 RepID=A0AAW2DEV9_9ROSI